jgi:RES domain-containing protein
VIPAEFNENVVETILERDLPGGWNALPAGTASKQFGDRWFRELRSAILCVPSVVIPQEFNYLINPTNPDFKKITIGDPQPLRLDPRLDRS